MRVVLVFVPLLLEKNWTALTAQEKHVGIMPPLSLAYAAAAAINAGHDAIIIDAVAEKLSPEQVVVRIKEFSPDILGFTITTYGFYQTLSWIKKIKSALNLPIVVGGWHLSLYPKETLAHPDIDYAIVGEADHAFPEFLDAVSRGRDLSVVKGVVFRKNGEVVVNAPREPVFDLDTSVFPARHLLKNELYYNILTKKKNFTVILSARGCPFRCVFCDLKSIKFRQRSVKNFVDEIEQCHRDFGINEFDVYDSSFTVNRKRVLAICVEIKVRKLNVSWTVRTRVDCVDKEILTALKSAGCHTVMYGIESGDREILKRLRKDVSLEYIEEMVRFTRKCGMKTLGFFVLGSPGETRETIERTMRFIKRLPLDYMQATRLTPFPNTEIYEMYMQQYHEDYWREFTRDCSIEKELPLVGTDLPPALVMRYIKKIYMEFYFRPAYILRLLTRMGSFFQLKNSAKAVWALLFNNTREK